MPETEAIAAALTFTGIVVMVLAIVFAMVRNSLWKNQHGKRLVLAVAAWLAVAVAATSFISAAWVGFLGAAL